MTEEAVVARQPVLSGWLVASTLIAGGWGYAAGLVVGHAAERQAARAYFDSCQALSATVDRSLEANRQHMLQSHGMAFIEGEGWVRQ